MSSRKVHAKPKTSRASERLKAKHVAMPTQGNVGPRLELENRFSSLVVTDSQEDEGQHMLSSPEMAIKFLEDPDDKNLQDGKLEEEEENSGEETGKQSDVDVEGREKSLEFTQAQVDELREENKIMMQYINDMDLDIQRNKYAIDKCEDRQSKIEFATHRKNLVIEGLTEAERGGHEIIHDVILDLFRALDLETPLEYDQAYRVGPYNPKRPRPIFISFIRTRDRDLIYSLRSNLQRSKNHYNVWVNEDLTPDTRHSRNIYRQLSRDAKANGARSNNTPHSVVIDGKRYDSSNLETLPEDFSLEKLKAKKIYVASQGEHLIAYHSEHAPFSNLYACTIVVGKRDFLCVEQILQYKRAHHHKNSVIANKILLTRDPYEMRQLGAEAGSSPEWEKKEEEVMFAAMLRKYSRNPELLQKLLNTGNLVLVEATPDTKWGAGASLNSRAMKSGEWKGKNRQGILTMQARNQLRSEQSERQKLQ